MTKQELQQEVNLLRGQISSLEEEIEGLNAKLNPKKKKKVGLSLNMTDAEIVEEIERRARARREAPAPAPNVATDDYYRESSWITPPEPRVYISTTSDITRS